LFQENANGSVASGNVNDSGRKINVENGCGADKIEKLDTDKYPGGYLTIYYGSQTGTAEMFAKQIASEGESRGFSVRVVDLQDVVDNDNQEDIDAARVDLDREKAVDEEGALIRATLTDPRYRDGISDGEKNSCGRSKALFFLATYGEGEPTDNATQFVEIMKGKSGISNIYKFTGDVDQNGAMNGSTSSGSLEETKLDETLRDADFLRDLDFAVFGLGNKQYEHYNNMGRFIDAALAKCGGSRIAPIGLGDDDDDLEGDFENWKENVMWPSLKKKYVKGDLSPKKDYAESNSLPSCPYKIEYLKKGDDRKVPPDMIHTSSKHYFTAVDCPISAKRELRTPSDPGSTMHIEVDISQREDCVKYQTADNLGILPKNDSAVVEAVAMALNFDLDQLFHLLPNTQPGNKETSATKHTLPFPTPCTVRECLEHYCDLSGPPRRSDLKQLASYAKGDIDRKALLRMSSKEGKAEYKEKIVESHVGIADIVTNLCQSIECPLEHFISVCPRLQPRYYTISSSSSVHPENIHITVSVLEENKKNGGKFTGVCTGYLSSLKKGDSIRVFVRDSTFRLPKQVERPIIMIGPGTGIAPMRAILQERSHVRKTLGDVDHGPNILYFGCKNRAMDYIYSDELQDFMEEGTLSELHLAFSREQEKKVYVQHLLAERGAETWKLIHEATASIFVCGGVKMGADVDHTLQGIISEQGNMTRDKAKAYLDKMAMSGRFVQELWS